MHGGRGGTLLRDEKHHINKMAGRELGITCQQLTACSNTACSLTAKIVRDAQRLANGVNV